MHEVEITAGEIAQIISGKLLADPNIKLSHFCEPKEVDSNSFCFVLNKETIPVITERKAALVIVPEKLEGTFEVPSIVVKDKALAMARLFSKLFPQKESTGKIDSTAVISQSAIIGKNVEIGAYSVIGEGVNIGNGTIIKQNVIIGEESKVGSDSLIYPSVTIYHKSVIGNNVILHSGCIIGADGFGFAKSENGIEKVHQIGNVVIEDYVEIGANSCVDRATIGTTRVGFGTKMDNQVQIGHNCTIGRFNIICGQVGLAGSVTSGDGVIFAGQVGVADHLRIGDEAVLGPTTMLSVDVAPGMSILGEKGYPARDYLRRLLLLEKLHEYVKRIKVLEDKIIKQSKEVAEEKALDH